MCRVLLAGVRVRLTRENWLQGKSGEIVSVHYGFFNVSYDVLLDGWAAPLPFQAWEFEVITDGSTR